MSVDCNIVLPDRVKVQDVANVLSLAAGASGYRQELDSRGAWALWVRPAPVIQCVPSVPEMVRISWHNAGCEDAVIESFSAFYHFENSEEGGRLLSVSSTGFWIAAGRRLVDFFGGTVIFQNDGEDRYHKPWRDDCHAEDGEAWTRFQERLAIQCPLSGEELAWGEERAYYETKKPWPKPKKEGIPDTKTVNGNTLYWVPAMDRYVTIPED